MKLLRKARRLTQEEREELIVEFMTSGLTRTQTRTCLSMYRNTPPNEGFQANLETSLKQATCTPEGETGREPSEDQIRSLVERLGRLLTNQEAKQRYFDLVIKKGFCLASELATLGQALCLRMIYQFNNSNKLELPISIHSAKGMMEESALVNSGAMENFID